MQVFEATASSENVSCNGLSDGTSTASPVNGTSPFDYNWSDGHTGQTNPSLPAGSHSVTITDANGCPAITDVAISEPPLLTVDISHTNETALNANDGTASASANGGTQGYTYLWSNGATTANITGLSPGTYSVTITDDNDCTVTGSASIQSVDCDDFQIIITWSNLTCFESNDGSASVSVDGETPPVIYLWSTGDTTDMIDNLAAGTYSVTVMDAAGCSSELDTDVLQPDEIIIDMNSTAESMPGANDGSATAFPSGGTPMMGNIYNYLWSNAATTQSISGLMPDTYDVTVTDMNGCTGTASVDVASADCFLAIEMDSENASCPNVADGSASVVSVANGTMPFTYLWSNGETMATIENLLPDDYTVVVTDANGCTANGWVPILGEDTEPPTLDLLAEITINLQNDVATFDPAIADNGSSDNCSMINLTASQTDFDCSHIGENQVTITGTDNNNNADTEIVTIIVTDITPPTITCPDDITVEDCGEVEYDTPTTDDDCGIADLILINGLASGEVFPSGMTTVTYEAEDVGGNKSSCSFEVFVDYDFQLTNATVSNPTCAGASDGYVDLFIEGGLTPYQSQWSHGGGPANLPAGDYSVTITDSNGCTLEDSFQLEDPLALTIDVLGITPAMGGNPTGSIEISIIGGTMPLTVEWFENGVLLPGFDPFNAPPGMYFVTVTDSIGCEMEEGPLVVDNLNSTLSPSLEREVSIFPNPTNGLATLKVKSTISKALEITVHDVNGKACFMKKIPANEPVSKIDLSEMSQGIYWVKNRCWR